MSSKAVLFDIGNVFVHWDPRLLYQKLIPESDALDAFLRDVVTLEWHTEHDRGRPFAEGVRILSEKHPEHADLIRAFDERWEETIGDLIHGTIDILERLTDAGIACYGLTNFSHEKWPPFCAQNDFTKLFKGVVVSGEEKLVKPDPRIFEVAISRYGLVPAATVYIDDRLDNVRAAEDQGMLGHHFTAPEQLEADLKARGYL